MKWANRFEPARKRGHFTQREKAAAGNWDSCAVGEFTASEREALAEFYNYHGTPVFRTELYSLGDNFSSHVTADDIDAAEQTYKNIQQFKQEHIQAGSAP